jgi:hypothetical protein
MSILIKLDGIKKGWKRHTTSAVFATLATLALSFGVELNLYVENLEVIWGAGSALYISVMTLLKVASDRVKA